MAEETNKRVSRRTKEVIVSSNDIEFIKDMLSKLSGKVQEMDLTLIKLNHTIIGDNDYGQKGIIEHVREHSDYIESDKTYKAKVVGAGSVLVILYGLVIKFWEKIF